MNQPSGHAERREHLTQLKTRTQDRAESDRPFKRAVGTLGDDLTYVAAALEADPAIWRLNRAFHTVHVPSLLAILTMLDDIEQMSDVSEQDQHDIYSSVHRAATLALDVRKKIEQSILDKAKIELSVLESYAKPPATPLAKPSTLTRAFDSLASSSGTVWGVTKSSAVGAANSVQDTMSGTVSRAVGLQMFARSLQKSVTGAMSDTLAKPITMRLQAGGRAIESGVGTGIGLGVIAGILFPPLLPLTAGGAVLAAMKTWRSEMAAAQKLSEAERHVRLTELRAERAAAMAQLTHGSGALQMETDDLSMTLDVDTGEADAIILSGEHEGSLWSSLSSTEKADAALFFADGASAILQILAAAVTEG